MALLGAKVLITAFMFLIIGFSTVRILGEKASDPVKIIVITGIFGAAAAFLVGALMVIWG